MGTFFFPKEQLMERDLVQDCCGVRAKSPFCCGPHTAAICVGKIRHAGSCCDQHIIQFGLVLIPGIVGIQEIEQLIFQTRNQA